MARVPSAETQLRKLRSEWLALKKEYDTERKLRLQYQNRATLAAAELQEWKARFDNLLVAFKDREA